MKRVTEKRLERAGYKLEESFKEGDLETWYHPKFPAMIIRYIVETKFWRIYMLVPGLIGEVGTPRENACDGIITCLLRARVEYMYEIHNMFKALK